MGLHLRFFQGSPFLLVCFFSLTLYACREKVAVPVITEKPAKKVRDVVLVTDSLVAPVVYTSIPDLRTLSSEDRKDVFVSLILPSLLLAKHEINDQVVLLERLEKKGRWKKSDSLYYQDLLEQYYADDLEELRVRMLPPPNSIALAQAIIESGWGTSRFFRKANNLFGIWSNDAKENRLPASVERSTGQVYLKQYANILESIRGYCHTIATTRAYRAFREANAQGHIPSELAGRLSSYSERGEDYVSQLRTIIEQNNLVQYDSYQLDPSSFKEIVREHR